MGHGETGESLAKDGQYYSVTDIPGRRKRLSGSGKCIRGRVAVKGSSKGALKCWKQGIMTMTQPFGHEKLIVYQKGMRFVALRSALLDGLARRVAACDHLDRGAESILVNIAHASNTWAPKERIVHLGHANGSALECAACLDVLVAKALLAPDGICPGKSLLAEIVSILITMRRTAANRVGEDHARYRTKRGRQHHTHGFSTS